MARYLPLPSSRHIRLLRLQSRPSPTEIHGILISTSIDDPELKTIHGYHALSYVWGEIDSAHEIILNGWSCSIRKNLWSFFAHYQHDELSPRYLWVDALCIDQQNMAERNSQVTLMSEIYRSAQSVLVWLGPADLNSDHAVDLVNIPDRHSGMYKHFAGSVCVDAQEALVNLLSREYWFRTWIIQEFLLGKKFEIVCGSKHISGLAAEKFCQELRTIPGENRSRLTNVLSTRGLGLLNQRSRRLKKAPLLDLVVQNRASICSDPHDKIYAMLGLASDCTTERTIPVDYSAPLEELFGKVLTFCNVHSNDIFRYAYLLKHAMKIEAQKQPRRGCSRMEAGTKFKRPVWSASGPTRKPVNQDDGILEAVGFKTGRLVAIGEPIQLQPWLEQQHTTTSPSNLDELITFLPPHPFIEGLYGKSDCGWKTLLEQLDMLDLSRLNVSMQLLESISRRTFPMSKGTIKPQSSMSPRFAGAALMFPRRALSPFVAALTFGHCSKNDRVVQLPGFDIALTMAAEEPSRLTGVLICVRTEEQQGLYSQSDFPTSQEFKYHFIRSPADSRDIEGKVKLRMTSYELFELVR